MIFVKAKWLPYILIIGGCCGILANEPAGGLLCVALGGGWLYWEYTQKQKRENSAAANTNPPVYSQPVQSAPTYSQQNQITYYPPAQNTQTYTPPTYSEPVYPSAPQTGFTMPTEVDTGVADFKYCRHCGLKLRPDDLFCVKCGTRQ